MDYSTSVEYEKFSVKFMMSGASIYDDLLASEFKKNALDQDNRNDVGDWVNFKLPESDKNIAMFSS